MSEIMKQTPLFEKHMQTASKVINLKGYARPVEYVGHVKEHKATREEVTICDVSHMGEIMITGKDSLALVQKIITNDASKMSIGQAMYSVMCNEKGHIIDDLICFRLAQDEFLWVVNVTKVNEDFQWILQYSQGMEVQVTNISCETALIALQGPNSRETLQKITKADLSTLGYYRLTKTSICTGEMEVPCIISRTGYTGERGYEVCIRRELAPFIWDELLLVGKPLGIVPHGVAARESLRIEAGLLLNGNDMDEATNPYEVSLGKVVKFTKDFIGKDALLKASQEDVKRILVGFEVLNHVTVRHGYPILKNGQQIGKVTSGPVSKNLINRSIGLGFVLKEYSEVGTEIQVNVRGKACQAVIVPLPFYPHQVKVEPAVDTYSPYDLKFSSSHFWVLPGEKDVVTIGLSDFRQREMGEGLFLDLVRVGQKVAQGSSLGWLDTYRKVWELQSPVSGEVVEVNLDFVEKPELINKYPYIKSGLLKIKLDSPKEIDELFSHQQYVDYTRELSRYESWSKEKRTT